MEKSITIIENSAAVPDVLSGEICVTKQHDFAKKLAEREGKK